MDLVELAMQADDNGLVLLGVRVPLFTIAACWATAMMFQHADVATTTCQGTSVTNFWPSLSDVTDVWPQRCIWRAVIALHVVPRLLLTWNYAQYLNWRTRLVAPPRRFAFDLLTCLCGALHAASVGALVIMACTSSRDYPNAHDAMLINWTWWSLLHMACTCLAMRLSRHRSDSSSLHRSRILKETLLALSVAASIGITCVGVARKRVCAGVGGIDDNVANVRVANDLFAIGESVFMLCSLCFDMTILFDVPGNAAHVPGPL